MFSSHSLFLFSLLSAVLGQGLTQCPTKEVNYTSSDSSIWAICSSTDYQAPSVQILNEVNSNTACAQLCQQYNNGACRQAVYDKINSVCHLKGNNTAVTWAKNTQFDAIRFVSRPTQGSTITACPNGEYNVTSTNSATWAVCPSTDYAGTTLQVVPQVASEAACANACAQVTGCTRAVYDAKNLACPIKDAAQTIWNFNSAYKTIRLVSKAPQQGDVVTFCPSGDRNVTGQTGRGFAVCNSTDFGGAASQITNGITSAFDCMQQCDQTKGCTKAVWDPKNNVCFLKDSTAAWAYDGNYQTIRLVNSTSSFTPGTRGKWAAAVNLPIVPAGAFIVPEQPVSTRILGYSSWGSYEFSGPTGITQFADYNWQSGAVSQRTVTNTKHDMFGPGMSFLANGTMVITGGENAEAVSMYDYKSNSWKRAADMKVARVHQSSTTLSNGNVFTIGGSFTGGIGGQDVALKNGGVYDAVKGTWTLLTGADVKPMLTTYDAEGKWRTDNHAWLFGWKNGYVFQAGPSKTMNWYGTTGAGSVASAGTRDADNDAMCGVNVMFDALAGKILSLGGSQSYTNSRV